MVLEYTTLRRNKHFDFACLESLYMYILDTDLKFLLQYLLNLMGLWYTKMLPSELKNTPY